MKRHRYCWLFASGIYTVLLLWWSKESHTNRVGSYGSLVANRNTIDASNISKLYISIDHKPKICLCNAKRYHCLLPFRYALYIMSLSAAQ